MQPWQMKALELEASGLKHLDGFIHEHALCFFIGAIYLLLALLAWVLSGALRRKGGKSTPDVRPAIFIHLPGCNRRRHRNQCSTPYAATAKGILCRVPDYAALSFDFPAIVERVASAMRHNFEPRAVMIGAYESIIRSIQNGSRLGRRPFVSACSGLHHTTPNAGLSAPNHPETSLALCPF